MKYLAVRKPGSRPYVAVINRLDQPVEGIVLAAKNKTAARKLSEQLTGHRISKKYLAVVCARDTDTEEKNHTVTLVDYLLKDGKNNTTAVVKKGTAGCRRAELRYRVCGESEDGKRLLEVELLTGRHHQIRVQLAHAGMPIDGDRKYGEVLSEKEGNCAGAKTLALCASELVFSDPQSGDTRRIQVMPEGEAFRIFYEDNGRG
jgi:23S rRNA pseudouridine1911/1915/1917 synthase